jgi:MbtH protein
MFDDEESIYQVVVNHEEQFSIWPDDRERPAGWQAAGFSARKSECLAWIDETWTDMRPKSLRERMDAAR